MTGRNRDQALLTYRKLCEDRYKVWRRFTEKRDIRNGGVKDFLFHLLPGVVWIVRTKSFD
jgi:hypothetical protein